MSRFKALAYQYLDLPDLPNLTVAALDSEGQMFVDFLGTRLQFDIFSKLKIGGSKRSKYSYPDLYRFDPNKEVQDELRAEFQEYVTGFRLETIYIIYIAQLCPHLGFTAALTMQMSCTLQSSAALRSYLKPEGGWRSKFHAEIDRLIENKPWHEKRSALPLIIFSDDERQVVNSGIKAQIPTARRMVLFERGFPYISYVIHADLKDALPSEGHHNDLALLMASPFFIEGYVFEETRNYRRDVLAAMEALNTSDVELAEKTYQEAWNKFEPVQSLLPATTTALDRITQKYPQPSFYAFIANDNRRLIDYSAEPAMRIADQVGRNLQTNTNQVLQRKYVSLTRWVVAATVLAALAAVVPIFSPSNMNILNPIALVAPARPDDSNASSGSVQPLDVTSATVQNGFPSFLTLHFFPATAELAVDIPFPTFGVRTVPYTVTLLKDNVVVSGAALIADGTNGLRVRFQREMFSATNIFEVQFAQAPNRVRLPLQIIFEQSGQ